MAQTIRLEFEWAFYHVMARGNRGFGVFLQCLADAYQKTDWKVHACVLMDNHYHILIQTPEANLVEGMKWLRTR
jgi:REP element-mobilizing transposase RayT